MYETLLSAFREDIKRTRVLYIFLMFYSENYAARNDADWREQLLHRTLTAKHVPLISSKTVIKKHAQLHHKDSFSEYYIQSVGHPPTFQNFLIAEEIKKFALTLGEE